MSTTATRIARVPYLNSVPFFRDLPLGKRFELTDAVPRALAAQAGEGFVAAGPLPLVEYLRLERTFERVGPFGIAVRGPARSALLFSRLSLRQLNGAKIAVTEESSTTACVLRLLLEQRYHVVPASYQHGHDPSADALLLIGDEALRFQRANTRYPFEIDIGMEWWLWQHLPCVFAVWAIRKDASVEEKAALETALSKTLAHNLGQLDQIAQEHTERFGMTPEEIQRYLGAFIYWLSQPEEEAIAQFRRLVDEHHLL